MMGLIDSHQKAKTGIRRDLSKSFGGVLYYSTAGHNKMCGQTIGANGQGEFVVVIEGGLEEARNKAQEILHNLMFSGHKLLHSAFVENDENAGYYGNPVSIVEATKSIANDKRPKEQGND